MERMKRLALFVLAMLPIAAVAFAAKEALNIAQIRKAGVMDHQLASSNSESHAT